MNLFSKIGTWFTGLFSHFGATVQAILHHVSSFVNLAGPIVTDLATADRALAPTAFTEAVSKILGQWVADAGKVQNWIASTAGMSTADVLRSAATTALATLVPPGTVASDLNLAVELAYSIFKATSSKA